MASGKLWVILAQPRNYVSAQFFDERDQLGGIGLGRDTRRIVLSRVPLGSTGVEIAGVIFASVAENQRKRGESAIVSEVLLRSITEACSKIVQSLSAAL